MGWWIGGGVVVVIVGLVGAMLVWTAVGVRLTAETSVDLPPARVWSFFEDPHNLAVWDRSVHSVEITSAPPYGVGSTFDTISPEQNGRVTRTSYLVTELVPGKSGSVDVVGSEQFRHATWITRVEPAGTGTRVVIEVEFQPKFQVFFLTPLLFFSRDNLMVADMDYLNDALVKYGRE